MLHPRAPAYNRAALSARCPIARIYRRPSWDRKYSAVIGDEWREDRRSTPPLSPAARVGLARAIRASLNTLKSQGFFGLPARGLGPLRCRTRERGDDAHRDRLGRTFFVPGLESDRWRRDPGGWSRRRRRRRFGSEPARVPPIAADPPSAAGAGGELLPSPPYIANTKSLSVNVLRL
jgi:hypothetical protein